MTVPGGESERLSLVENQLLRFTDDLQVLIRSEQARAQELDRMVDELRENQVHFARQFALVVEGNDVATRAHLDRTMKWATAIAARLDLPDLHDMRLGFLMHDIGKWMVPKEIIMKPGPLTEQEKKRMQIHPAAGAQMVSDVPLLRRAMEVIRAHHERWDGEGYPYRLKGEDIPRGARVFAVADVFDALTSDRPYREAMSFGDAGEIISKDRGSHFDPEAVDVFMEILAAVVEDESTRDDQAQGPVTPAP